MGVAEVDLGAGGGCDRFVEGEFAALVPGEGASELARQLEQASGEGVADFGGGVAGWEVNEDDVAADTFHQGPDRGVHLAADDQVALPVPGLAAVRDFSGALVEQFHVGDLVLGGHASPLGFAAMTAGAQLARQRPELSGVERLIDRLGACLHRGVFGVGALQEP